MTSSNEANPDEQLANVEEGTGRGETDQPDSAQPGAKPELTQREAQSDPTEPSPEKDPADWVTGDEPATGPQLSYLGTLAQQAGEQVPDDLTKARASQLIDELQARTGRGGGADA
jgi:Protein of unknown function (DUF3072)